MKTNLWKKTAAGIISLLMTASCLSAVAAQAAVPDFDGAPDMPAAPFGTAGTSAPYYSKPCNERLAMLPEALMKLTDNGYSWEYTYVADKPEWPLTLMDYANIYSFIHSNDLNEATVREILADSSRMVHRKAFTDEEIDILMGDDQAAAMSAFASPSTIVIGEKGYSAKWMYCHDPEDYEAEGITPEMVAEVQPYYYNALYVQEAADAFSQKLLRYSGKLTQTKWHQWKAGDVDLDGSITVEDTALLSDFLDEGAELNFSQWASADLNGDSDVTGDDLIMLRALAESGTADDAVMLNVMEYCQYPDYPTGCESVSLFMLLSYYGIDVRVDDIYDLLPMGLQPYDDEDGVRHGANPEREFVGNPRSEYSYGVFNDPIADVAAQFKSGVQTERGASVDEIKAILDTGNPVLAWYVSAPMRDIMYRWSWIDETEELVTWPGGEHAVVVCGYDDDSLTYRDPNAGTTVCIDYDTFEKSFTELGGRIVYYTDKTVSYIDDYGQEESVQASVMTGNETEIGNGCYTVSEDLTIDGDLTLSGNTMLVLADGCTLTVNGSISGDHSLSVFGQTEGTGVFSCDSITVGKYAQCGGKTVLTGNDEFTLTAAENIDLMGGQFETDGGVSAGGSLTFGFTRDTDYIQAGQYQSARTAVRPGEALYIPDFPNDLSLLPIECTISFMYNGQEQKPGMKDILGKIAVDAPFFTSAFWVSGTDLELAKGQKIRPYPEEFDPKMYSLLIPLTENDFKLGEVDTGKDVFTAINIGDTDPYEFEIIGKGSYTGSTKIMWFITAADVSEDITVTAPSPIVYDGQPAAPEDFSITASSELAQELIDGMADGSTQAQFTFYSTTPLADEYITTDFEEGKALANGHIYDAGSFFGGALGFIIGSRDDVEKSVMLTFSDCRSKIFIEKDGERLYGYFEINDDGVLCYNRVEDNGEEKYIEIQPITGMYWTMKVYSTAASAFYEVSQNCLDVQITDASEPGDYIADITVYGTGTNNFNPVTKTVPFTIENDESGQIAPDATLLEWAENDYSGKTGKSVTASVKEKQDGQLTIELTDENGAQADTYKINTSNGRGTDQAEEAVDLPQTGNNSMRELLLVCAAFLMMLAGGLALRCSGVIRRRNNEEDR